WIIFLDNETTELLPVHLGKGHEDVRKGCIGDPHFFAIDHPMRSILASHSICLCGKRVRTTASFRQSVSRNFLSRAEQRQIFAFVFFLAKVNDRQRADTAMPAIRDRERS